MHSITVNRRSFLEAAGIAGILAVTPFGLGSPLGGAMAAEKPAALVAWVRWRPDGAAEITLAEAGARDGLDVVWRPVVSGSAGALAARHQAYDAARRMLAACAARQWGLDPARCRAEAGSITDGSGVRRIGYAIWVDFA